MRFGFSLCCRHHLMIGVHPILPDQSHYSSNSNNQGKTPAETCASSINTISILVGFGHHIHSFRWFLWSLLTLVASVTNSWNIADFIRFFWGWGSWKSTEIQLRCSFKKLQTFNLQFGKLSEICLASLFVFRFIFPKQN